MTDQKFSDFTLNFNPGARTNAKAPTLKGKAKVLDPNNRRAGVDFEVAAWGPNKAQTGGPDFYNVTFTPNDPALAARQVNFPEPGPVRNQPEGFELKKLGIGRIFERTDAELAAAHAKGTNLPKFWGHGLVLLPSGPAYIDLSAWLRDKGKGFYSGNAPLHDRAAAAAARAAKPGAHPR
jgi:hypothetical protein